MKIIQLNPPIPLEVVKDKDWEGPAGKGFAIFLKDYGIEYDDVWVVIMENREIWNVPNRFIRGGKNITFGRK